MLQDQSDESLEAHRQQLLGELRRRGLDPHTAEDVVQETWLRTLKRNPEDRGLLAAWLRVVALRLVSEHYRSQRQRRAREKASARGERIESALAQEEALLCLWASQLEEPYRTVVRLNVMEQLSPSEIAERLGRSPSTVRSQLRRGLDQIRARARGRRTDFLSILVLGATSAAGRRRYLALAGRAAAVVLATAVLWLCLRTTGPESMPVEMARAPAAPASAPVLSGSAAEEVELRRPAFVPEPPAATEHVGAFLKGRVLDAVGQTVAGARIFAEAPGGALRELGRSDAAGTYEALALAPGELVFAMSAERGVSRRIYPWTTADPMARDIRLLPVDRTVQVRVVNADGLAMAGAEVALGKELDGSTQLATPEGVELTPLPFRATTAGDGEVVVPWPARPACELRVHVAGIQDHRRIVLREEVRAGVLEVRLPQPLTVRGLALNDAGQAVENARVLVSQAPNSRPREARSGRDGSFEVTGLAAGLYQLRIVQPESLAGPSWWSTGSLAKTAENHVVARLSMAHTLVGRALTDGRPLAGKRVLLRRAVGAGASVDTPEATHTDHDGNFAFGGCEAGVSYVVDLFASDVESDCIGRARLTPGEQPGELNPKLDLDTAAALEFELVPEPGAVLPKRLELRHTRLRFAREASLAPGQHRVSIPALPKAEYELLAFIPGMPPASLGRVRHDPAHPAVQRVPLPAPGWLEVIVDLPQGSRSPLRACQLTVPGFAAWRNGAQAEFLLPYDEQLGRFRVSLLPGTYPMRVAGVRTPSVRDDVVVRSGETTRLQRNLMQGTSVRVKLEFPNLTRVDEAAKFEVLRRGSSEPQAIELRGSPEPGVVVLILPRDAEMLIARTKSGLEGKFALDPAAWPAPKELLKLVLVESPSVDTRAGRDQRVKR